MAELLSKAFVTLESAIETVELAAATPGASIARGRLQAFSARFDAVCLAVNGPAAAAPLGAAPTPPAFAAEAPAAAAASDEPSPVVPVEKKKRGRPRKESEVSQAEAAPKVPKPRGRPPKAKVEGAEPAPKKPRGRPPKVPKKESEKPKPAKKSVDPKYKTPKGQATKPSTAGSENSPPKSKPTGGMLNKKVMATWDSDIAYPARVTGVTWSDSLNLLTHVNLKFDDGAFWNNAPVTTIKGLA